MQLSTLTILTTTQPQQNTAILPKNLLPFLEG